MAELVKQNWTTLINHTLCQGENVHWFQLVMCQDLQILTLPPQSINLLVGLLGKLR